MIRPRTLAVHTGGIGDFILALPALEHVAREGPLELAGRRERLQLAVDAGIAEAAHDLEAIAFDSVFATPSQRLAEFVRRFDRVIVWMRDDDGVIESTLHAMDVAEVRVVPGLPPDDWGGHASAYYAACVGAADRQDWRLRVLAAGAPSNDVIFHPGSGGRRKNWPVNCFAEVARALDAQGSEVWWSLGPAEEGLMPPAGAQVLPPASLTELAQCLAGAALYLGNDSGITHLAAAVGCPTVAVFGPTEPRVWAPRGAHVRVVRGEPWPRVEAVVEAAWNLRAIR